MRSLIIFTLFAITFARKPNIPLNGLAALIAEHGGMIPLNRNIGRIVGGDATTIERFPWTITMQYLGSHRCGGSIISATRILSAAHCTMNVAPSALSIRAGSTNSQAGGQLIGVNQIINHPQFNPGTSLDNDICVMVISSPLNTDPAGVAIVPMPVQGAGVPAGAFADVAGWGATCEDCPGTNILRFVSVPVLTNAECNTMYGGGITAGMLCAGFAQGGRDACQNDSGGPLTFNNQLIGVVSWGIGCARPNSPGVYARVAHFRNWINELL